MFDRDQVVNSLLMFAFQQTVFYLWHTWYHRKDKKEPPSPTQTTSDSSSPPCNH